MNHEITIRLIRHGKFSGKYQGHCEKCWLTTKPKTERKSAIQYLAERKCDAGLRSKIEKLGNCLENLLID